MFECEKYRIYRNDLFEVFKESNNILSDCKQENILSLLQTTNIISKSNLNKQGFICSKPFDNIFNIMYVYMFVDFVCIVCVYVILPLTQYLGRSEQ